VIALTTAAVELRPRAATTATTATTAALRLSNDRKVSPLIRRQSAKDSPAIPNAFGLTAGLSCPGRTGFCRSCYAENLERAYTSTAALVRGNYELLAAFDAAGDLVAMVNALNAMVRDYWTFFRKALAAGRVDLSHAVFRIHWDGDYFSDLYARAWSVVVSDWPHVQFWSYTRSYEYVAALAGQANHAVYLSVDAENVAAAAPILAARPDVHAAYCATTQTDAAALAVTAGRGRPAVCPENVGNLPLVVAKSGRRRETVAVGDDARGACVACGLCVYGRRDVAFATSGK